ncbi:cation-transporting P-type ATPase B domain protein [Mycobacterium ulcerans str. Harvey]|uniref:Cation-transporting P-type ATPase B domain protein n=1 Tax=Mycobacterium ulcerans str. Harvey TaxID=1299332 RepID=A0ABP3A8F3_MYCUL|nr:cation-transporting P-type ATPase B domain protein [Mycobacterium ulcerans str. Harvey]
MAIRNARHRTASMETLISVGITAATVWSLSTVFVDRQPRQSRGIWQAILNSDSIYLEVAAGVTVSYLPAATSKHAPSPRPAAHCAPWRR